MATSTPVNNPASAPTPASNPCSTSNDRASSRGPAPSARNTASSSARRRVVACTSTATPAAASSTAANNAPRPPPPTASFPAAAARRSTTRTPSSRAAATAAAACSPGRVASHHSCGADTTPRRPSNWALSDGRSASNAALPSVPGTAAIVPAMVTSTGTPPTVTVVDRPVPRRNSASTAGVTATGTGVAATAGTTAKSTRPDRGTR
jgi:hypothetical protein